MFFFFYLAPSNFKSLLLRAEVLKKMNHFQSSLADVENALKCRYTSAKVKNVKENKNNIKMYV